MLSPIIKQPIYECTKKLLIQSLEKDCKIEIRSIPHLAIKGVSELIAKAESKSDSLILELKRNLVKDEIIQVIVTKNGEKVVSDNYRVDARPNEQINIKTFPFFYNGARCIKIWDILPFSTIQIMDESKIDLVSSFFDSYNYVVAFLKRPLVGGENIEICTTFCQKVNSNILKIPVTTIPLEELPSPVIIGPLHDCQNVLAIKGLFPGANVTAFADGKKICNICSGAIEGLFGCVQLRENQEISVQQSFTTPPLKSKIENSIQEIVNPISVKIPIIRGPIYDSGSRLYLDNLESGAEILIEIAEYNSNKFKVIGDFVYNQTTQNPFCNFPFDFLAGQKIKVTQTLCKQSKSVIEEVIGGIMPLPPEILEPVYECTSIVRINPDTKSPGSRIRIESLPERVVIGEENSCIIPVIPLFEGQQISAVQIAGGVTMEGDRNTGSIKTVQKAKYSEKPIIIWDYNIDEEWRYIDACRKNLEIIHLTPGANIFIFAEKDGKKILIGSGIATNPSQTFFLIEAFLFLGMKVYGQSVLCNLHSDSQITDKGTIIGTVHFNITPSSFSDELGKDSPPLGLYYIVIPIGKEVTLSLNTKCVLYQDLSMGISFDKPALVKILGNSNVIIPKNQKAASINFIVDQNRRHKASGILIKLNIKLPKYFVLYGAPGGFNFSDVAAQNGYDTYLIAE